MFLVGSTYKKKAQKHHIFDTKGIPTNKNITPFTIWLSISVCQRPHFFLYFCFWLFFSANSSAASSNFYSLSHSSFDPVFNRNSSSFSFHSHNWVFFFHFCLYNFYFFFFCFLLNICIICGLWLFERRPSFLFFLLGFPKIVF